MPFNVKPAARKNNTVVQPLADETLIYDLASSKAFCLNQTSAMVWQLCDGEKSIAEIAKLMSKNLKTPVSEDFVWLAIGDLQKEDLIEVENNQPFFEGKSRREVIRKIGFASMIALPVISSLVAPRAVDAQSSCRTTSQSCTSLSNNTQSNCCSGLRCRFTATCSACFTSGTVFVDAGGATFAECRDNCPTFFLGSTTQNVCCNPTTPGGFTFAGGICRCTCG